MKGKSIYKRDNRSNMKFGEWLTIATHSIMLSALEIKKFSRPKYVGDHKTPETLAFITMRQLVQLSHAKNIEDVFYLPCSVLLGMTDNETRNTFAVDVVRWAGWVSAEIDSINEVFKSLRPTYSTAEQNAGVENLSFGIFGLVDWYARRMGMTNHDEAYNVQWRTIVECLKIDMETNRYQQRLQKQYIAQAKRKR